MASSTDALLTEHLTYPPVALVDDIVNSINTLSFRATSAVEKGLLAASPSSLGLKLAPFSHDQSLPEDIKHEIENGVHQLETLLESKIDKNFDKFEIYVMRNILTVPAELRDYVRLSHYEGLDFSQISLGNDGVQSAGPTTESVKQQRLKLREMMKLQTLLLQEKQQNEATLRSIQTLLGQSTLSNSSEKPITKIEPGTESQLDTKSNDVFSFLQNKGSLKADRIDAQLKTSTDFALSNLPGLKSILEDLQPRLDSLQAVEAEGAGDAKRDWQRERAAFVEKETKRHLTDVRGLELGEQGEVRDGEWQGEGRKIGMEEVEALERVGGLFAKEKEKEQREGSGERMDQS